MSSAAVHAMLAAVVAVGVLAVVAGGADDSPGLQGVGALVITLGVGLSVRRRRRSGR